MQKPLDNRARIISNIKDREEEEVVEVEVVEVVEVVEEAKEVKEVMADTVVKVAMEVTEATVDTAVDIMKEEKVDTVVNNQDMKEKISMMDGKTIVTKKKEDIEEEVEVVQADTKRDLIKVMRILKRKSMMMMDSK